MHLTHRLELSNGTVFDVGADWPTPMAEMFAKYKIGVGMIFYMPEESTPFESDSEEGGDTGTSSTGEHYEIWGMTTGLAEVFAQMRSGIQPEKDKLIEAMNAPVLRRIQHLDARNVIGSEETWDAMSAFKLIAERSAEQVDGDTDAAAPAASNGQPQPAQVAAPG